MMKAQIEVMDAENGERAQFTDITQVARHIREPDYRVMLAMQPIDRLDSQTVFIGHYVIKLLRS
jgi:hypothetical protein